MAYSQAKTASSARTTLAAVAIAVLKSRRGFELVGADGLRSDAAERVIEGFLDGDAGCIGNDTGALEMVTVIIKEPLGRRREGQHHAAGSGDIDGITR